MPKFPLIVFRKVIIISNTNELVRVTPEQVVYVASDGNYTTMVLYDNTEHVFTMNLSHFQQLVEDQLEADSNVFIRIGKQLIINRTYIYKININKQQLLLSGIALARTFELSASREALKSLKALLESEI